MDLTDTQIAVRIGICALVSLVSQVAVVAAVELLLLFSYEPPKLHLQTGRASISARLGSSRQVQAASNTNEFMPQPKPKKKLKTPPPDLEPVLEPQRPKVEQEQLLARHDMPTAPTVDLPKPPEPEKPEPQRPDEPEPDKPQPLDKPSLTKAPPAPIIDDPSAAEIQGQNFSSQASRGAVDQPIGKVYNPPPEYPPDALAAGRTGRVVLLVLVGSDGLTKRASVYKSSGTASLDASALKSVYYWRFTTPRLGGQPISSEVRVPIDFKINSRTGRPEF